MAPFAAKYASPLAKVGLVCPSVVTRALASPRSLFVSPSGFLDLAEVASGLAQRAAWIWLDELDRDPISLLSTVMNGARLRTGRDNPDDVGRLARHADRPDSWPALYRRHGEELADLLSSSGLVLVDIHYLDEEPSLRLLSECLLPSLTAQAQVVLVSERDRDARAVGSDVAIVNAAALRLDDERALEVAAALGSPFSTTVIQRAAGLTDGRRATLASVLVAGALMGPDLFERAVSHVDGLRGLLDELTRLSLKNARTEAIQMLALVAHLGLTHPRLVNAALGIELTPKGPWLLPLELDWARVDPLWRLALSVALVGSQRLTSQDICRLADQLIVEGAPQLAIPLYREVGNAPALARSVGLLAAELASSGRWGAFGQWAQQLATGAGTVIDADSLAIPAVAQKTPRQGIWQRWRRRRRERTRAARSVETPPELADALVTAAEERNPAPSVPLLPRATISNSGSHLVMAYLLGPFTLVVNGQPIEAWHGTRGRSVLKYLLAHHGRPVPRDVLMDAFWRDIGHAAARNSLNVALSNLRRTLRPALGDVQPILHEAGAYRLNPDLDLWVDVDEFEQRAERGFQLHAAGELAGAASELTRATSLYRGPYQEDDPYAETAILTRDRLRVLFLEVLDQLGDVAFVQGRYDDCIALAQAMLGHDRCREDAHRRIMRCYGRQSRTDLALRQYQACVAALRDELDVEPSPASTELHAAIRQHRVV